MYVYLQGYRVWYIGYVAPVIMQAREYVIKQRCMCSMYIELNCFIM